MIAGMDALKKLTGDDAKIAHYYTLWMMRNLWDDEDLIQSWEEGHEVQPPEGAMVRDAFIFIASEVWPELAESLAKDWRSLESDKVKAIQVVTRLFSKNGVIRKVRKGKHWACMPDDPSMWHEWQEWWGGNMNLMKKGLSPRPKEVEPLEELRLSKFVVSTKESPIPREVWREMMDGFKKGHLNFIVFDSRMKTPSKALTWEQYQLYLYQGLGADDE